MFFRYPAATISSTVFGTRWCSKLYLRSAWVSSASAAFRAASDALESAAAAVCSVAGAGFPPCAGSVAETGVVLELSWDFPQPVKRTANSNGRTTRHNMLGLDRTIRKIQAASLPEADRGSIPRLSVTERAVHGASMSLAPRLWLNIPNSFACSRRGGLKAALPGADNSRMHWRIACNSGSMSRVPKNSRDNDRLLNISIHHAAAGSGSRTI